MTDDKSSEAASSSAPGWIRRYRASGLALGSFGAQHGLSRNRLHYWVYDRRFAQPFQAVAVAPVFQELKVTAGLPPQNWAAEISLPTGAQTSPIPQKNSGRNRGKECNF